MSWGEPWNSLDQDCSLVRVPTYEDGFIKRKSPFHGSVIGHAGGPEHVIRKAELVLHFMSTIDSLRNSGWHGIVEAVQVGLPRQMETFRTKRQGDPTPIANPIPMARDDLG